MTCVCHVSLSGKRATGRADSKGVLTLWVANCDASVFFPFFSPIPLFNCRLCGMCPPPHMKVANELLGVLTGAQRRSLLTLYSRSLLTLYSRSLLTLTFEC